jgi:putative ABC transport system permease protein
MQNNQGNMERDPWPIRWLYFFCKPYYVNQVAGDLLEIYHRKEGGGRSSLGLFWMTIGFMRLRYLKSIDEVFKISGFNMYRNYFKISFRNLNKHRGFALLNISGLAVGLAGALMISMHLINEWSYDRHIPEVDQIYYLSNNGVGRHSPAPLSPALQDEIPGVIGGIRCWSFDDLVAVIGENVYTLPKGIATDSTFFDLFPNEFIQGTPETALSSPQSVVLTQSIAYQLFGNEDPVGQVIEIEGEKGEVTAVVKDIKKQTSVPYDYIVSLPHQPYITNGSWTGNNFFTFIKTSPGVDTYAIELKTGELIKGNAGEEYKRYGYDIEEVFKERPRPYQLVSLTDIHLKAPYLSFGEGGSINQFLILIVIGALLLIIAIINYINLVTARSGLRLKEIGLRKVFGSQRSFIIKQFYVESFVVVLIAFFVSIIIAVIALPFFSDLVQRELTLNELFHPVAIFGMVALLIVTALLSGSYPAMYLSSFSPIEAVRGEFKGSKISFRKGLVVFQFFVSIMLISITYIVFEQVSYMRDFSAGWDRETTFAIRNMDAVPDELEIIKNELKALPFVEKVSLSNTIPSQEYIADYGYSTLGEEKRNFNPDNIFADAEYMDLLGLELLMGRFFDAGLPADSSRVVINAKFAAELGWENPVGRQLTRGGGYDFTIIGVINDFYPTSVKRGIRPMVIRYADEVYEIMSVSDELLLKLSNASPSNMQVIANIFEKYSGGYPFEGVFLEDSVRRLYKNDERFGEVFSTFSGLALFIASLGLISLASFSLERRTKEIAVRKVLGAGGPQLINLLLREYLILIGLAAVIASPIVYYYAEYWLEDFANRIQVMWLHFVIPIMTVLLLTIILIIGQTIKAATSNPVIALKQE